MAGQMRALPTEEPSKGKRPVVSATGQKQCEIELGLYFSILPLRFFFVAKEGVFFPPGKSANILRGALGSIFRRLACVPQCPGARTCELRASCPYARLFEPSALGEGPSGLADWPRPFVFRAIHLDGCTIPPGGTFHFDLNLFDSRPETLAYLVVSFAQLAREGVGPRRGRAELRSVTMLDERGGSAVEIFNGTSLLAKEVAALRIGLAPVEERVRRVQVRFVTPTELKCGGEVAERPEFGVVASRIRDRVSTLRSLYGEGPLEMDFAAFGERAAAVRLVRCAVRQVDATRQSSRTGQVHPIGGFVGEAEYEGELAEFVPFLRVAKWTGVGRQTVWGKGEIGVV